MINIVDASPILYVGAYGSNHTLSVAEPFFNREDGKFQHNHINSSGLVKAYFSILSYAKTGKQVWALDSTASSPLIKSIKAPYYKANRKTSSKYDIRSQKRILALMLEDCNVPYYESAGYEADDIIFHIVNSKAINASEKVIIWTEDNDMAVNVRDNVSISRLRRDTIDITKSNYEEVLGFAYNEIIPYKMLEGDKSDNIHRFALGESHMQFFANIRSYVPVLRSKYYILEDIIKVMYYDDKRALYIQMMERLDLLHPLDMHFETEDLLATNNIDFDKIREWGEHLGCHSGRPEVSARLNRIIRSIHDEA